MNIFMHPETLEEFKRSSKTFTRKLSPEETVVGAILFDRPMVEMLMSASIFESSMLEKDQFIFTDMTEEEARIVGEVCKKMQKEGSTDG